MELYPQPARQLPSFLADRYEEEAQKWWEGFYKRNGVEFFKDRHYLDKEFPELLTIPHPLILEVGCGVGNACYPLLASLPESQIFAVDFSNRALNLLRGHCNFDSDRLHPVELDILDLTFRSRLNAPPLDFATMVFVLSALSPEKMPLAVRNMKDVLKPNQGRVLLRDYATGDLAQGRFEKCTGRKKLGENFYLRGDGTRCYYFTKTFLRQLFEKEGFSCEKMEIKERNVENRKRKLTMNRRWIQAVFLRQAQKDHSVQPC